LTGRAALVLAVAALLAAAPAAGAAVTITEPATDGQVVNPADVHMEAEGFESGHSCSDWQILEGDAVAWQALCAQGVLAGHIHLGDGDFVGDYAGRTELDHSSGYVLRVRDPADDADWVQRSFTTSEAGPPGEDVPVPWKAVEGYGVEVVATGFRLPVNVVAVPDPGDDPGDPFLYVVELYGTIKVVKRDGSVGVYRGNLLPSDQAPGNIPGAGERGITGIAVDPANGDVLASVLYPSAGDPEVLYGKVVRMHSEDGGLTAAGEPETVLDLAPESQPGSHQISNLTFGPDGMLYVHNGEAFVRDDAQDLESFRGKVLRVEPDGDPPPDNPFRDLTPGVTPSDFVWAYGLRNPFGGAWRASDGKHYEVENGPATDRFADVPAGRNFGWGHPDYALNPNGAMVQHALYAWPTSHAPVNLAFVEPQTAFGSGFPEDRMGHAFVSESGPTYAGGPSRGNGKRISELVPGPGGSWSAPEAFAWYIGTGKATVSGLAAASDGLYFTDLYKDGGDDLKHDDPGANLLRVRYGAEQQPYVPPGSVEEPPSDGGAGGGDPAPSPPPPPLAGPPLGPPAVLDRVPPVVDRLRARRRGRRVTFSWRLSELAAVRLAVVRIGRGGRRVAVRTLRRDGRPGANAARLVRGRGGRRLRAGLYVATLTARDLAGNRSRARTVRFRIPRT
jgi:glucose/arabinose dehydrogenase